MYEFNDFNDGNTLKSEKAENNEAIYTLKTLYKIFLWLPLVLVTIELIVAVITIASLNNIDDFTKIIAIVLVIIGYLLLLGLIVVLMAVTRLMIFHTERIDYNTRMLLELTREVYSNNKNDQSLKIEEKDDKESIFENATNELNSLVNSKIIDDQKFYSSISALRKLETYKNSDKLVLKYFEQYESIKSNSVNNLEEVYNEIINKLVSLYQEKKIDKKQYDEYVAMLKLVSTKPEKERLSFYEKISMILNSQ